MPFSKKTTKYFFSFLILIFYFNFLARSIFDDDNDETEIVVVPLDRNPSLFYDQERQNGFDFPIRPVQEYPGFFHQSYNPFQWNFSQYFGDFNGKLNNKNVYCWTGLNRANIQI